MRFLAGETVPRTGSLTPRSPCEGALERSSRERTYRTEEREALARSPGRPAKRRRTLPVTLGFIFASTRPPAPLRTRRDLTQRPERRTWISTASPTTGPALEVSTPWNATRPP